VEINISIPGSNQIFGRCEPLGFTSRSRRICRYGSRSSRSGSKPLKPRLRSHDAEGGKVIIKKAGQPGASQKTEKGIEAQPAKTRGLTRSQLGGTEEREGSIQQPTLMSCLGFTNQNRNGCNQLEDSVARKENRRE